VLCGAIGFGNTAVGVDRPSVTELPGLTSDPIYTADRRGGILISFGPTRRPVRDLNPSCWPSVRGGRVSFDPDRAAFAFRPECPCTLKGIGLRPAGIDRRGGVCIPSRMPWYT
jgi:hypothetical protein